MLTFFKSLASSSGAVANPIGLLAASHAGADPHAAAGPQALPGNMGRPRESVLYLGDDVMRLLQTGPVHRFEPVDFVPAEPSPPVREARSAVVPTVRHSPKQLVAHYTRRLHASGQPGGQTADAVVRWGERVLKALRAGPQGPEAPDVAERVAFAFSAMREACDLLRANLETVEHWLGLPETQRGLAERGLRLDDVRAEVQRTAESALGMVQPEALEQGRAVFTLMPSSYRLYTEVLDRLIARQAEVVTPGTTPAVPTGTPAVDPLQQPRRNQAEALAWLKAFELRCRELLPQWDMPGRAGMTQLWMGGIDLRSIEHMLALVPPALSIDSRAIGYPAGIRPAGADRRELRPVYPHRGDTDFGVTAVTVGGRQYALGLDPASGRLRYTEDGLRWVVSDAYTDPVVTEAQCFMWNRILLRAFRRAGWVPDGSGPRPD